MENSKVAVYALYLAAIISSLIAILDHFKLLELGDHASINIILLTNGLVIGLLGMVLESSLYIKSNIASINEEITKNTLDRLAQLKSTVNANLKLAADAQISSLIDRTILLFKDNTIHLDDIELFRTIYKTTLQNFSGSTFYATSIPEEGFFWKNKSIESSIYDFIKAGGKMKRIFFIDGSEKAMPLESQRILRIQHKIGVQVYTSNLSEIPLHLQRFFMVETERKICWEPIRGPDNKIKSINITSEKERADTYLSIFWQLLKLDCTREYKASYLGLDPHRTRPAMTKSDIDTGAFSTFEKLGWQSSANDYNKYFTQLTNQTIEPVLLAVSCANDNEKILLDAATGPGNVASSAIDGGFNKVLGIDFSEVMVSLAKQLHKDKERLEFRVADIEHLNQESIFDAVTVNFGLLHLGKPEKAISEIYKALKENGRFCFTVWASPPKSIGFAIVLSAIEAFADPTISIPEGPPFFYFSDPTNCISSLEAAGFQDISVREIDLLWELASGEDLFNAFLRGTARTGGLLRAQTEERLEMIKASIIQSCEQYFQDNKIKIPMTAVMTVGTKLQDRRVG